MGDWEIIQGDCVEAMKAMPDMSFDAVVTDPPYGVGLGYASFEDTREAVRSLAEKWLPEALRLAPIVAFTPGDANLWMYPEPTGMLGWSMKTGTGCGPWGFKCHHTILVYGKCPYLKHRKGSRPDTLFLNTCKPSLHKDRHPCAKPFEVMDWLLNRVDPFNNARILDPFCGSGTTGVCAIKSGRSFVGIEMDEGYAELSRQRLRDAESEVA